VLATYDKQRDLIILGAYQYGTDPKTDYAIDKIEEVETFLRQNTEDFDNFDDTVQKLIAIFADAK
jgi:type III secretion protein N (ATPase)